MSSIRSTGDNTLPCRIPDLFSNLILSLTLGFHSAFAAALICATYSFIQFNGISYSSSSRAFQNLPLGNRSVALSKSKNAMNFSFFHSHLSQTIFKVNIKSVVPFPAELRTAPRQTYAPHVISVFLLVFFHITCQNETLGLSFLQLLKSILSPFFFNTRQTRVLF